MSKPRPWSTNHELNYPPCKTNCNVDLCYVNTQGLLNKGEIFDILTSQNNIDVLCFSEHWLKSHEIDLVFFKGFKLASYFCRENKLHGGSAIFIKDKYSCKNVPSINSLAVEEIFEVSCCHVAELNSLIVCFYRVPNIANRSKFFELLNSLLSIAFSMNTDIIISGDFNIDFNSGSEVASDLCSLIYSYGLHIIFSNVITRPGIIKEGTCIDNIITSIHPSRTHSNIIDLGCSDHLSLNLSVNIGLNINSQSEIGQNSKWVRSLEVHNLIEFIKCLKNTNWIPVYCLNSANDQFEKFFDMYLWAVNLSFPLKNVKHNNVQTKKNPVHKWFTSELNNLKSQVEKLSFLSRHSSCPKIKQDFNRIKYKYRQEIKKAKLSFNNKVVSRAVNRPKQIWKIIKDASSVNSSASYQIPTSLNSDIFNDFFVSSVQDVVNAIPQSHNTAKFYASKAYSWLNVPPTFSFTYVSVQDVHSAILSLSNSSCFDMFNLSSYIVKHSSIYISEVLCHILNKCFDEGVFPDTLKISKVVPVLKKGDSTAPNNYRPISLVPVLSKVFEKVINMQIIKFLEINNLLFGNQFGFRKGRSTCDAVLKFIQNCLDGKESKCNVGANFYDFSKAFDTVCHNTLIVKLNVLGFDSKAIKLVKSYLKDRSQSVYVHNSFSKLNTVPHGVPQGSILGPLLFIIYVNDLPNIFNSDSLSCYLYADDLCVSYVSHDPNFISCIPSDVLTDWCNANSLSLNLNKTQELVVSYDHKLVNISKPVKFLGITIQGDLGWKSHIKTILHKLNRGVFLLRKLNSIVSKEVLLQVYYGYIHSHLNYGTLIWANNISSSSLFSAQKQAVRALFKVNSRSHCKQLFIESNIMSLPCIYIFQCLLYAKDNINTLQLNSDIHNYGTRHCELIRKSHYNYSKTTKSFHCTSINLFNKLPKSIAHLNPNKFKIKIKHILIKNCFYSLEEYYTHKFAS